MEKKYKVLARKYRPKDFNSLIGQEVLVKILSNAIKSGRLAQAFMLTGVRGVGKTTTARIIAMALNCDAINNSTNKDKIVNPCGKCKNCDAIINGVHLDVLEMDAASNTGVNDIRESIIDTVNYTPTEGRYKIYILDEVHMLSNSAFNSLLKTLEEPPEHVKFIFATTEIRKVPVTILSRCQRFDLKRVDTKDLYDHFKKIVVEEGYNIDSKALNTISIVADGSVRDGLSILDQAMALSQKEITYDIVISMLGLSDRSRIYSLYDNLMQGNSEKVFLEFEDIYKNGADPLQICKDLLDITWWLTRIKVTPGILEEFSVPEIEKKYAKEISSKMDVSTLTRNWQIISKGIEDVRFSVNIKQATEMILIKLIYVSNLETPNAIINRFEKDKSLLINKKDISDEEITDTKKKTEIERKNIDFDSSNGKAKNFNIKNESIKNINNKNVNIPNDFRSFVKELYKKSPMISYKLTKDVSLISYNPPKIVLNFNGLFSNKDINFLDSSVKNWLGNEWVIEESNQEGKSSIFDEDRKKKEEKFENINKKDIVKIIKKHFVDAYVYK